MARGGRLCVDEIVRPFDDDGAPTFLVVRFDRLVCSTHREVRPPLPPALMFPPIDRWERLAFYVSYFYRFYRLLTWIANLNATPTHSEAHRPAIIHRPARKMARRRAFDPAASALALLLLLLAAAVRPSSAATGRRHRGGPPRPVLRGEKRRRAEAADPGPPGRTGLIKEVKEAKAHKDKCKVKVKKAEGGFRERPNRRGDPFAPSSGGDSKAAKKTPKSPASSFFFFLRRSSSS